jgi:hypothetical protein
MAAHLILLDLICLMILEISTNYEASHCATSSVFLLLHPSYDRFKYSP